MVVSNEGGVHAGRREWRIFSALDIDGNGLVERHALAHCLQSAGLLFDDPRLAEVYDARARSVIASLSQMRARDPPFDDPFREGC